MNSYIRETKDLGEGRRLITRYTPGEYLVISIIKFFIFLFFLWPIELLFWAAVFIIKWAFKALFFLIALPFKLILKKDDD